MQAVEEEDFDAAKHFKSIVDKLMIIGNELQHLHIEK